MESFQIIQEEWCGSVWLVEASFFFDHRTSPTIPLCLAIVLLRDSSRAFELFYRRCNKPWREDRRSSPVGSSTGSWPNPQWRARHLNRMISLSNNNSFCYIKQGWEQISLSIITNQDNFNPRMFSICLFCLISP